ncbi:hypothetical protein COOONC_21045, partial [Cooperia oncophora]
MKLSLHERPSSEISAWVLSEQTSSNAIAPIATLVSVYKDQNAKQETEVPIYVLLFGVLAICFGLWTLGYRIIGTVGSRVSHINPA